MADNESTSVTKDLGIVSAYGYAKAAGYTGTEEEFEQIFLEFTEDAPGLLDRLDEAVSDCEDAASDAADAKTAAENAQTAAEAAAATFTTDTTLAVSGKAADAKVTGDNLTQLSTALDSKEYGTLYFDLMGKGSISNSTRTFIVDGNKAEVKKISNSTTYCFCTLFGTPTIYAGKFADADLSIHTFYDLKFYTDTFDLCITFTWATKQGSNRNVLRVATKNSDSGVVSKATVGADASNYKYRKINLFTVLPEIKTNGNFALYFESMNTSYPNTIKYYFSLESVTAQIPETTINSYEFTRKDITTECEIVKGDVSSSGISDDQSTHFCRVKIPQKYINDVNILEVRKIKTQGKHALFNENSNNEFTNCNIVNGFSYRSNQRIILRSDNLNYYVRVGAFNHPSDNFTVNDVYSNFKFNILQPKPSASSVPSGFPLINKSVVFFGDSIVAGRYSPSAFLRDNTTVQSLALATGFSFGDLIHEKIGDMNGWICAVPGGSVSAASSSSSATMVYCMENEVAATITNGYKGVDVVVILAGTNDFGGNVAVSTFKSAYETLLGKLPNTVKAVCCSPTHRTDKSTNSNSDTLSDFADAIEEVAPYYIDLLSLTNNTAFEAHLTDGLHPDMIGHSMIADAIINNFPDIST